MTNRLQYLLGPPGEAFFNDLYEVETLGGSFVVSFAIAQAIVRALDQFATPDWIEFRDVFGERHLVLALCVYRIRYLNGARLRAPSDGRFARTALARPELASHL